MKAQLLDALSRREREILAFLSEGLTDQQIAQKLFLSLNTVKWYNRQIYGKLAVNSRTQAIATAKDMGLLTHHDTPPPAEHRFPEPNSLFIGRDHEIAEIKQLFTRFRLLTLTGTGGIGKTRLALRAAKELVETLRDGGYFVDLASLSDHQLVIPAIARVFDILENSEEPLLDTLKRGLADREILLVLDNFEHVIRAAPAISELLTNCPNLKVLITSREALRIAGEQEYPVPPLSLPVADSVSPQTLTTSEAGALFVQRVQMILPHFEVNEANALTIAQICTRLDGLPLAIELAATRCKLLTPHALLERLSSSGASSPFRALASGSRDAPSRQQTLESTVAWSYNLLEEEEKTLFARLAVFRGGRSLEAVDIVCCSDLTLDVLDGLASLVDKNLLKQKETPGGEPRFIFLEMIHEYARDRLEESGEAGNIRQRHAEYYVGLVERAEPELRRTGYDRWTDLFDLELDNIRKVIEWSLTGGDLTLGVRLTGALGLFWYGKGYHAEGLRLMQPLLRRLDEVPIRYHSKFLISAAHLVWIMDLEKGQQLLRRALDVARTLDEREQIAWAEIFLGYVMLEHPETAYPHVEEGLAIFHAMGHQPGITQALNIIGEIARNNGDVARARAAYEECLAVVQETGELRRICYMCNNLAYLYQHEGEHARALVLGYKSLRLACDRNDKRDICVALGTIAGSLSETGQPLLAARLLGAADAALERLGAFYHPSDRAEYARFVASARSHLDDAAYESAREDGRSMTLTQAITEALRES